MDQEKLSKLDRQNRKENLPCFQFSFNIFFPAGGLLKSSPNTFVEIMLRKTKLKTCNFSSFRKSTLQGFFRLSDSFPMREESLIKIKNFQQNSAYKIH
jgi:hypothetical protein